MPTGYRENGRPCPDFLGGGENIRSKDYINIGYWPENFLSVLALDGVFEASHACEARRSSRVPSGCPGC